MPMPDSVSWRLTSAVKLSAGTLAVIRVSRAGCRWLLGRLCSVITELAARTGQVAPPRAPL